MAGLVPAIHDLRYKAAVLKSVVDARHKGGHDEIVETRSNARN